MEDILFLLVTCSKEVTRFETLRKVLENISTISSENVRKDFLVFDNASSYPGSVDILTELFPNVVQSKENIGFWSAIFWCLNNYQKILKKDYKYLYIIESDIIHTEDAFSKLDNCKKCLDEHDDIGFVRTEEFSIANRHLYDKMNHHKDSRRHAWVTQHNPIENKRVYFEPLDKSSMIYTCNFLSKLPSLTRMKTMKDVFNDLSSLEGFVEFDYQRFYYEKYKKSAILDGGIWHSKLGSFAPIMGSTIHQTNQKIDYKHTRSDKIIQVDEGFVKRL